MDELFEAIRRLEIISITLNQDDNPQLIFESLNSTGVALSEGDKIRNFILMGLPTKQQNAYYEKYWNRIEVCNMIPSTLSVATSFIAVYLTFRRSPYFALAYAANDVLLILLWTLAAVENISYLSVIICFVMFLVNDLYGFVSWKRMEKRQMATA